MDRFASFIGADIHPVTNGALDYKGVLHIMHDHHAEAFSIRDMWSLVHMLEECDNAANKNDMDRAVYMTKLVSTCKSLGCKFGRDVDEEICRIIEKEKNLFKKCSRHVNDVRDE